MRNFPKKFKIIIFALIGAFFVLSIDSPHVFAMSESEFKAIPRGNLGKLLAEQYTTDPVDIVLKRIWVLDYAYYAIIALGFFAFSLLIFGGIKYFASHNDQSKKILSRNISKHGLSLLLFTLFLYAFFVFISTALG